MITTLIEVLVGLATALVVGDFAVAFLTSSGATTSERLWAAGRRSTTILWGQFVVAVTGASSGLVALADTFNAPGVADAIKAVVQPVYVAGIMVGVSLIYILCRSRTLPPTS